MSFVVRCLTVCVGLLLIAGSGVQPLVQGKEKRDRFYFEGKGLAFWQVQTKEKLIALTFDDGPDPTYTPQVLKLLQAHHDQGTFFLIGEKVLQYPDVVRETLAEGHELGNHTYSHRHLKFLKTEQLKDEMNRTSDAIFSAVGRRPICFRPPRGFYDERTVMAAHEAGYPVIMWSWDEDSRDWEAPGVHNIVKTVMDHVHPGDIILFHDGTGNSKQTIAALRQILPMLHQQGYKSVTVSTLLTQSKHQPKPPSLPTDDA